MWLHGLLGYLVAVVAIGAGLLGLDLWARDEDSTPAQAWQSYRRWYQGYADYLIDRTPVQVFALWHAASLTVGLTIGVVSGQPLVIACGVLGGLAAPVLHLRARAKKRRDLLRQQIDPALQLIANALQVAPSLDEALSLIAHHLPSPMADEMRQVVVAFRLGRGLDDALQGFAERCNDPFITAMVIGLVTGRRTGGNIAVTLRRIAFSTREAVRVELELDSKTRGQRNQFFFVAALYPLGIIGVKLSLPDAWHTLMNTYFGQVAMFVSMGVMVLATAWALKILSPQNL